MCRRLLKGLSRILKGTHIRDFDRHVTSLGHQSEELSERGPKFFNYVPYLFPGGGRKIFQGDFALLVTALDIGRELFGSPNSFSGSGIANVSALLQILGILSWEVRKS